MHSGVVVERSNDVSRRSRALLLGLVLAVSGSVTYPAASAPSARPAAPASLASGAAVEPPPNDRRVNAERISGASGSVQGTTVGASGKPSSPRTGSVWFTWTARGNGLLKFENDAHSTNSYLGAPTDRLKRTGTNCDATGYESSCVFVRACKGRTYTIEVWAQDRPDEAFTLSWSRVTAPPNDDFADAAPVVQQGYNTGPTVLVFPDVIDSASGRFATIEPGETPTPLPDGPGEHSIWYRWTPAWSGTTTMDVDLGAYKGCYSGATGLEVATGTDVGDLDLVASDYSVVDGETCETVQVTFRAVTGTAYSIRVDSRDGTGPLSGYLRITPDCETSGTEGDDIITGTPGDDVLCGLGGDDVITGSDGDDIIVGGAGTDTISYAQAEQAVDVSLTRGVATGQGEDTLSSLENITGSGYDDRLEGNNLASIIKGRRGDDTLIGNDGDNVLYGRAGDDTLIGGYGEDFLGGGSGNDSCDGGYGPGDRFRACETRSVKP